MYTIHPGLRGISGHVQGLGFGMRLMPRPKPRVTALARAKAPARGFLKCDTLLHAPHACGWSSTVGAPRVPWAGVASIAATNRGRLSPQTLTGPARLG